MKSFWNDETGKLACKWSEAGRHVRYTFDWMREDVAMQGGYLPPVPDFASHSPFGGPSWFEWHGAPRKLK